MSESKVYRPQAGPRKIASKDEFELCYLRHQYLRRVDFNPTAAQLAPYYDITKRFARSTHITYQNLFIAVGLGREDLTNIANVHLVSFIGLFALERKPDKYLTFVNAHEIKYGKTPLEADLLIKNRANFTMFLKQRFAEVVRISRQKIKNIKGFKANEYDVYYGTTYPPAILSDLVDHHEKFGYKRLDIAVYKTLRKKARAGNSASFEFKGVYYVTVPREHPILDISDFNGANMDPYDNVHNISPDRIYFDREQERDWAVKQEEFTSLESTQKASLLTQFIAEHDNKPTYRDELKAARKLLKEIT